MNSLAGRVRLLQPLTEDTGDILVVGLQAGFHENKALVNLIQPGLQGSNARVHGSNPVGQAGMASGIGAYDGYDQRYQVYGLFVHVCYLPESVTVPLFWTLRTDYSLLGSGAGCFFFG